MLDPLHECCEQLDRLRPVARPAVANTRSKIEPQEAIGLSLTQRATDRIDVVHSARSGDDVIGDAMPEDRPAVLGERSEVRTRGVHHSAIALHKLIELRFERVGRETFGTRLRAVGERARSIGKRLRSVDQRSTIYQDNTGATFTNTFPASATTHKR